MIKLKYEKELGDYVSSVKLNEEGSVVAVNMANGCSYLIRIIDKEILKYCYGVSYDVSYLHGTFSFVTFNGVVYMISERGELINLFQIGSEYSNAIASLEEGIMVCNTHCALYTTSGERLWSVKLRGYVRPGMRASGDVVYAILEEGDGSNIITVNLDGEIKRIFGLRESILSIDVCDELLAVGGSKTLTILSGEGVWKVGGFDGITSLRFSKDCREIMVADMYNKTVTLFEVGNDEEIEMVEESLTTSMDWRDVLVVGSNDGRVKMYEIMFRKCPSR